MKVLMINGSPHKEGCTNRALQEVARSLNQRGVETEILHLGKQPLWDCVACGACRKTGKCIRDDLVNETTARLDEFDGFIFGSPVYYAGPTGLLTSFLDRLFYSAGSRMVGKPGAAVVSCRRGGASASFDRLNKYFTISGMPVVPSQYWNAVHGNTPEEVEQDAEGLQIMRTLGENMAWMLESLAAGRAAGVKAPAQEPRLVTNFIR